MWVMRTILHDWSDEESAQILATLRAAIGATPVTLTIVEVCPSPQTHGRQAGRARLGIRVARFEAPDDPGDPSFSAGFGTPHPAVLSRRPWRDRTHQDPA